MAKASQSAIARYQARRRGEYNASAAVNDGRRVRRLLAAVVLAMAMGAGAGLLMVQRPDPVQMDYEIDLAEAPGGSLTLTMILEGDLPRHLDLAFPPGAGGERSADAVPHTPTAHEVQADGSPGRPLAVERRDDGWRLATRGSRRIGLVYRVDLTGAGGEERDIRRHISTLVNGGVRAAGFEIFLAPRNARVADITVTIRNPHDLPVLAPWPTLVHGRTPATEPPDSVSMAHLGAGQRFLPAESAPAPAAARPTDQAPAAASLLYHPRDLADLNNALLVCGDLRTAATQARDCVIQYATDRRWNFADDEALDLVRRIGRTELGFFGSAPSPSITVLLAANEVTAEEGFDVYGIHTGSSVLVMIDRETTWGELEEQAASVIAHEMFHGWLGEAIPQEDPETLWFTEGATTWYAARMLTAAGIWSPAHARKVLGARLERDYLRSDYIGAMPVAEAAARVMADPGQVRYAYAGGVAVCASLDAWLARRSGIERPLDGVLRHLYDNRDGEALSRQGLEDAVHEVTGVDCGPWLDRHAYGKTALPLPDELI